MPTHTPAIMPLVLEPIFGPPTAPIRLVAPDGKPGMLITLGRLPECQVQMPETEKTVSRKHCHFESVEKGWQIVDLGSRHGTFINNVGLPANTPHLLREGDGVRIGPWTFRVVGEGATNFSTLDDTASIANRVVSVSRPSQDAIDRRRLQMLIKCSKLIHTAGDEFRLAAALLDPLLDGTGYARVAVVRGAPAAAGGPEPFAQIEVLAAKAAGGGRPSSQFSRSLLQAASHGQIVQLRQEEAAVAAAMSMMATGTATAMAIPVILDKQPVLFMYLDSRRDEPTPHDDAAAYCQAIAEMCSLAIAAMQRSRLEAERLRFTEQMEAGMAIQRQLLPKPRGQIGCVEYALELRPGRYVAGDLVDFIPLSGGRLGFFIGDVSGKGLPAAILMATTQSYLNAALRQFGDPARVADEVNAHLASHAADNKFVSLWLGVLDLKTGLLEYVDAGHGFMVLRDPATGALRGSGDEEGGAPLRVFDDVPYQSRQMVLTPGTRLVLYSDGVIEQDDRTGVAFGPERVTRALAPAQTSEQDVQLLVRAVLEHAGSDALSDDLTVASLTFNPQG